MNLTFQGAHVDNVYMSRGTSSLLTMWTPMLGPFDFQNFFSLDFLFLCLVFCIQIAMEEASDFKNENCLDAEEVKLYSKHDKITKKSLGADTSSRLICIQYLFNTRCFPERLVLMFFDRNNLRHFQEFFGVVFDKHRDCWKLYQKSWDNVEKIQDKLREKSLTKNIYTQFQGKCFRWICS